MQQQTITYQRVKKDLFKCLICDEIITTLFSMFVFTGIIIALFLACRIILGLDLRIPLSCIVLILVLDGYLAYQALHNTAGILKGIAKNAIIVSTAKLTNRIEGGYHRQGLPGRGPYVHYELHFYPYNPYLIPSRKHYKWSQDYCMSEKELFNSSEIQDEFIIVTHNKKDILMIYNKKFFEVVE